MRIKGLDSIRFICAIIVVLGHLGGPPLFNNLDENVFFFKVIKALYSNIFNGPAAVIVFFVISGFVIHYPYVNGKKLFYPDFFTKRFLRLGIPMAAITAIVYLIGGDFEDLGIFWSLYAELIYYALYPVLLFIKARIGLYKLIISSLILGYIAIIFYPYQSWNNFVDLGNGLTWLIGLPSWLIGLLLAENSEALIKKPPVSFSRLNIFRFGIFLISVFLSIAKFHLNISYTVSLNLFAIIIYFWLSKEIAFYNSYKTSSIAEWGGTWSYSLYICHILSRSILKTFNFTFTMSFTSWIIYISYILLFSYLFYLIVERPSHLIIKKISLVPRESKIKQNIPIENIKSKLA